MAESGGGRGQILASHSWPCVSWQSPDNTGAAVFARLSRIDVMRVYFARQIWAKSYQILSAVTPDSFIFCHSIAHSCIRARDARGKVCGCDGGTDGGIGAPVGTAGLARSGGGRTVAGIPTPAGRSGGSGAVNGGRGWAGMSSAHAGPWVICTAANMPSHAERFRARCLPRIGPKRGRRRASVRIVLTIFVHS
jgi:hypothetical protein